MAIKKSLKKTPIIRKPSARKTPKAKTLHREARKSSGTEKPETGHPDKSTSAPEETRKRDDTGASTDTAKPAETEHNKPTDTEDKLDVSKEAKDPKATEEDSVASQLAEIKNLLSGLLENFEDKKEEEVAAAGSGPSESSAGESGGGAPVGAPPVSPVSSMNRLNPKNGIDQQLTSLATRLISMSSAGGGQGQMIPIPYANGGQLASPLVGMLGTPQNGNPRGGAFQFGKIGNTGSGRLGAGAVRQKLLATYQQAGGAESQSIRPETHQLVQLALSLSQSGVGFGSTPGTLNPLPQGISPEFGRGLAVPRSF